MDTDRHYLSALFEPASIAIIGASEKEGSIGRRITRNLLHSGYSGELHLVNRRHAKIFDYATHKSPAELPSRVELAIICTASDNVLDTVAACAKAGVRSAIVLTAGYAQIGTGVTAMHREIGEIARRHGMRVLGPDSLGFLRPAAKINATQLGAPTVLGSVALISQSSGLFSAALDWGATSSMGCSLAVSMGTECDVDFGEVLDYLVSDHRTESIFLFIESIKNARRFMSALRAAARCKPVLLIKIGRNATTARARLTQRHNALGADDVFDAALRRAGVVRVDTLAQMQAAAVALFSRFRPRGNRLAVIVNGSGPGIMALDRASDLHIPMAQLLPETLSKLARELPVHWLPENPIDIFSDADPARYATAIAACLADSRVDGLMVVVAPHAQTDALAIAQDLADASTNSDKPILACWLGGHRLHSAIEALHAAGIPTFRTPEPAVELFSHLSAYFRAQQLLMQTAAATSEKQPSRLESAQLVIENALHEGRQSLSSMEAKAVLAAFRIPIAQTVVARSATEAMVLAEEIGLPVVMKISSPDIRQKTDCGGVRLNLTDLATIRDSYAAMIKEVKRCRPDATIEGISIEPMVQKEHGRELMIGMFCDPVFGPTISFGLGGAEGEVDGRGERNERAVALPPLNPFLVDMLRPSRISTRLGEFRKMPPVSMDALQIVLLRISELVCELPWIKSLSINPLIIDEHGAIAVDSHIDIAIPPPGFGRYDHVAIHPYPAHLVSHFATPDGESITLRPIRPEDAAMEQAFVQKLSPNSRYLRFMNTIRELSPMQLVRLTQIDYDRELAFVAILDHSTPVTEIGVARYVTNPDGQSCEFAIVIADAWQGKGLARRLMTQLIEAARDRGLKFMTGDFLCENSRMIRFAQSFGFEIGAHPDDGTLMHGVLPLTD